MNNSIVMEFSAFLRSFAQNIDSPFAFLLGAGASLSSGIPSAAKCVWEWKKSIYISEEPTLDDYLDINLTSCKEKIQNWIEIQHPSFPKRDDISEYEFYAEYTYMSEVDRRKFFESLCHDKKPYIGYQLLCLLFKFGVLKSVWTTNFDGLIERAAHINNLTPIGVNLDNPTRIFNVASDRELLYVALHGDYKYSKLKNTSKELDSQQEEFKEILDKYFFDKNLIVLGYSGRDKSLMEALTSAFCSRGAGRLFWCGYGEEIPSSVAQLINNVRAKGREAYYIPTEGFDKTLTGMLLSAYKNDHKCNADVNAILKSYPTQTEFSRFKFNDYTPSSAIKTNVYPILLPKDVFQFELSDVSKQNDYKYIRELIKKTTIMAAPFNGKVYAYALAEDIYNVFDNIVINSLKRTPITLDDIKTNSALFGIIKKTLIVGIAHQTGLNYDIKHSVLYDSSFKNNRVKGFEAIKIGIDFKDNVSYALMSIDPILYFRKDDNLNDEQIASNKRKYYDGFRNQNYEDKLKFWEARIFHGNRLTFDYPIQSNNHFVFTIGNNRGEISLDYTYKGVIPSTEYTDSKCIFQGKYIDEPKLCFGSTSDLSKKIDANPMRGLKSYAPYDYQFFSKFTQDVNLSVICPVSKTTEFNGFLKGLMGPCKFTRSNQSDYIQDYDGFNVVYNCPINIPATNSNLWISCKDQQMDSMELVQNLCKYTEVLANRSVNSIVVIFIPSSWEKHKVFVHEGVEVDLHSYVKAFAAQKNISTQFIEEKTLNDKYMKCEIYWWLSLALFVKSFRTPWILEHLSPDTAYAGIGYSLKKDRNNNTKIVVGCSHVYNSKGQGLKYKLAQIEDVVYDEKKNPHLSYDEAFKMGMTIQELFVESLSTLPRRVVIHKRTKFLKDEIDGIVAALDSANIHNVELLTITEESQLRGIEMDMQRNFIGKYPVRRGVCVKKADDEFLLWTHGTLDSVLSGRSYYAGGKGIPKPLKVKRYYGTSSMELIASEILGFTKMNWNSFNFYTRLPATIDSSNTLAKIGNLLSHRSGVTYDYRYFI